MKTSVFTRLRTIAAIGPLNIARVCVYRGLLWLGIHPVQGVSAVLPTSGPFFKINAAPDSQSAMPASWNTSALLFGRHTIPIDDTPPAWTRDPLSQSEEVEDRDDTLIEWWEINEFASKDIKCIWELSRFDWVVALAQRARNGDEAAAARLDAWLSDWGNANPAYFGPNWKCAQEASVRVLHLSVAAIILNDHETPTDAMRQLITGHIRRIIPTLSYARAQDNNHATSEAAAIFVAGAWFQLAGDSGAEALLGRGRDLLERAVIRLFARDGSFSQYSLNYHRFALDTLAIVERWRQIAMLEPFSQEYRARLSAAANWLRIMVDPANGDAPNLGANDGANLLQLTNSEFRDHRPAVQLATALFRETRAYPSGPWDDALKWLGVFVPVPTETLPRCKVFDEGGYAVLRRGPAMAMMRYPRFRFRPSQADAMHVDLWHSGLNLLRDAGSYSYNTDFKWINYFSGVQSHNTVQFDGAPQMPRLSRFLLGDWLETETSGILDDGFFAVCRYPQGWRHLRETKLTDKLVVSDEVEGFNHEACLRWRLAPGDWTLKGGTVTDGRHHLSIRADVPVEIKLVEGWEARHYLERTPLPVVEVTVTKQAHIVSEYHWTS